MNSRNGGEQKPITEEEVAFCADEILVWWPLVNSFLLLPDSLEPLFLPRGITLLAGSKRLLTTRFIVS